MKKKITISLPTADEFTAGLTPTDCHPGLASALLAERQAAIDLDVATSAHAMTRVDGDACAAEVHAGRLPTSALERAHMARTAAGRLVPLAEAALAEATRSRVEGEKVARRMVLTEAARRNAVLEQVAAELAPVLDALVGLEMALEQATTLATGQRPSGLPAVVWPECWRDANCKTFKTTTLIAATALRA